MLVEEIEDNPLYPPRFVWDPDSSRSRSSADQVIGAPQWGRARQTACQTDSDEQHEPG